MARDGFWQGWVRSHRTFLTLLLLTFGAEQAGWLQRAHFFEHDVLRASQLFKEVPPIHIIGITDDDYATIFDKANPARKPEVLYELVQAALDGGARAVGVDLDTSTVKAPIPEALANAPVVWGYHLAPLVIESRHPRCPAEGRPTLQATSVSGGQALPKGHTSGIYNVISFGSITRAYEPVTMAVLPSTEGQAPALSPSLQPQVHMGRVLVDLAEQRSPKGLAVEEPQDIKFVTSCGFLPLMTAKYVRETSKEARWKTDRPFDNKIVLIGGTYAASGDVHETPIGRMYGVQVLANIVETERGNPLRPSKPLAFAFEYLAAFAYYTLVRKSTPLVTVWCGGLLIPIASIGVSLFLFVYGLAVLSISGALIGIYVEQIGHLVATYVRSPR